MNKKIKILLAALIALVILTVVYMFTKDAAIWGQTRIFQVGGENGIVTTTPVMPKEALGIVTTTPIKQVEQPQNY